MSTYLIKKKEDFAHVFRNGSFLNNNCFTINYAKKSKVVSTKSPRFGIVVSKKVGNAVQRNFAKRRTKALKNIFLNCGKNEFDYILVAKKTYLMKTSKYLVLSLNKP